MSLFTNRTPWIGMDPILGTLLLTALLFCPALGDDDNWPRFRGPNGQGLSRSAMLPTKITDQHVRWKADLAGSGSSSPVSWGEKLFLTSYDREQTSVVLEAFDRSSGKRLWEKRFKTSPYRVHRLNSYASSTPAVDRQHVYLTFASPDQVVLLAVDHDGNEAWRRDLGTWRSQHGYGASPIVHQDKVILFLSQQSQRLPPGVKPGESKMIAVSARDGSDRWSEPLTATRACYAVPAVLTDQDGQQAIASCNTGDGFFALDPESGKRLWSAKPFRMRTVASLLIADGLLIGSCGSGGGGNYLVAMRQDSNNRQPPTLAFEIPRANYVPSPVALEGLLFLMTDKGIARCVDLETGNVIWEERVARGFSGSPVAANGHLYVIDDAGELLVIKADRTFNLVSKYKLGEQSKSTPAIVDHRLYLRTDSHLFCVGNE